MSNPGILNTSNSNPTPVNSGLGLTAGKTPKMIPLLPDLTVAQSVLVDLTQQQQGGQVGPLQTIYINNSANEQSVTVISQVLNQSLTIPGGDSAILPFFLSPTAPRFTVNSTGGVQIPMAVFDIPLPAQVWGSTFGSGTFQTVNGLSSLNVVDTALQALISNIGGAGNALDVNVLSGGGGGSTAVPATSNWSTAPLLLPNGNSNILSTFPNIAGKTCYAEGFEISMTPNAANGVGQSAVMQLYWGVAGTTRMIWQGDVYVPAAAPATIASGTIRIAYGSGFNVEGDVNDHPSLFWGGTTWTSGALNVNVWGYVQ